MFPIVIQNIKSDMATSKRLFKYKERGYKFKDN